MGVGSRRERHLLRGSEEHADGDHLFPSRNSLVYRVLSEVTARCATWGCRLVEAPVAHLRQCDSGEDARA
jgi:hypothetical protein